MIPLYFALPPTPRLPPLLHLIIPDLTELTIKCYKEGKVFLWLMQIHEAHTNFYSHAKKKSLPTLEHLRKIYKEKGRGEVRVLNSSLKSGGKKP